MSMPFRFADSENDAITLPVVGHIQPRLSSSISGTRAASGRLGVEGAAFATGGGGVARASAGAGFDSAIATCGADSRGADSLSCASACSVYGTLIAFGSVLNAAVFGRPLGTGAAGRA